ncbi:MAG: hypothetical protein M3Y73_00750, partial [Actinomycetota bacterium]|nr:hypothetical protein [Actinomycetota bacterium]
RRTMPADPPRPTPDRWRDAEGTHISLFSMIEQVAEHPEPGTLFSRLHQRGEVVGRGPDLVYVRFHGEGQVISVPPCLLRVLDTAPEGC